MELDFPTRPEALDADWLGGVLARPIESFEMERVLGGFWSRIVRVAPEPSASAPTVIAKFANPNEQARAVSGAFDFGGTELSFYREAASDCPLRTPRCYAAELSGDRLDYVLILEDLGSYTTIDQLDGCPVERASQVVSALVELHAHWWGSAGLDAMPWVRRPSDPVVSRTLPHILTLSWERAFEGLGSIVPNAIVLAWPRLLEELPLLLERLHDQPSTLVHGDVRLSNLFFDLDGEDAAEVAFIDWQVVRRTHGCYDLAYFLTQSLSTETRRAHERELLAKYRKGLLDAGVATPTMSELFEAYRLASLYCMVYPIVAAGGTKSGSSPEAAAVAERAFNAVLDWDALELL